MARNTNRNRSRNTRNQQYDETMGSNHFEGRFQSLYSGTQEMDDEFSTGYGRDRKKKRSSSNQSSRQRSNSKNRRNDDRRADSRDMNGRNMQSRNMRQDPYARGNYDRARYDQEYADFFNEDRGGRNPRDSRQGNRSRQGNGRPSEFQEMRNAFGSSLSILGKRTGALLKKANGDPEKQRRFRLPERNESNFTLLASVILLLVVGIVMVTSSSYYYAYYSMGDSLYFFRRQIIWTLISIVAMVLVSRVPLTWIRGLAFPIYLFSILCNILVFFIGTEVNGSTRWLGVGSLSFQPAELSKLAVAIYISKLVDDFKDQMGKRRIFFIVFAAVLIPTGLVAYQNLSSGIIVAAIGVIIMFIGGARIKHFIMIIGPVFGAAVLLVILPLIVDVSTMGGPLGNFLREFAYRSSRVSAWLDPFADSMGDGYQTVQALYAVGSGGFFGRGLGHSIQKLGYIPFAYNDIIFAVICEELGIFGAGIVMLLFGVFTWNGVKISLNSPNRYTMLLTIGLTGQIALQAVLNVAVNTNSMPATGISLPFISYGGSSMLFLMASVGLILNISTYGAAERKKQALAAQAQVQVDPGSLPGKEGV